MGETNVTTTPVGSAAGQADKPARPSGTSARAARTRQAVVDALLALLDEGNLRPTAREVADRAGVSLRSVYVHFDDVEALFVAAAIRHHERREELRGELKTTGTFAERLDAFVEWRALSFEMGANVRRAAVLQEPFSPAIRDVMKLARRVMKAQIDDVFGPELAKKGTKRGAFQRSALTVVSSPSSWDDLRLRQHLSEEEAKGVMAGMIRSVLDNR